MRVMPSVTLKPVSVKVKTGALRVTGLGTSIGGWGEDSATGSVPGPDPPQAPKNKASAIDEAEREMSFFIHGIEIKKFKNNSYTWCVNLTEFRKD
jgi:hypothetical protein